MVFNRLFWLGLLISLAFLVLLLYRVDFGKVGKELASANYFLLIPAIALYFVAVFFRTLRWRYLLAPMRKFSVARLYPVVIVGYMANNLLPFRLGELVRPYYLRRREKFSASTALATIVVERVYDGLTLLFLGAITIPFLWMAGVAWNSGVEGTGRWVMMAVAVVLIFLAAIGLLSLLATSSRLKSLVEKMVMRLPAGLRGKVGGLVVSFIQGLQVLRSPRRHLGLFVLSLPVWLFEGAMYYIIGLAFDLSSFFTAQGTLVIVALLVTATSNLATTIPSSMGGIGPFEYVAQRTLVILGVNTSVATAYVSVLHIFALLMPVTLLGLFILWRENLSLAQIAQFKHTEQRPKASYTVSGIATGEGKVE